MTAPDPWVPRVLVEDEALLELRFDLVGRRIELRLAHSLCRFDGVHATTLLSAWDGSPGRVERLVEVHRDEAFGYFELRVRFGEVPRNYRVVATSTSLEREDRTR